MCRTQKGSGIAVPVPYSLSKEAKGFIFQCFHVNPRDRPTASQLLDNPFVRRPLPLFLDYAPSGQSSSKMRYISYYDFTILEY
ncbi:mitogen-activated protein kinase kinase kinase 1 [Artemisia annua]|uniref:Mitogen-activated protein kinase kinase kinase 1 n=1 Tax=Artemisia annua TaxID=35608 RepID=A0A2U1LL84_ARTAN|nr:mitogen-activated protein kinase kinase kinase 1 [Artemisia annua]